ncbi:MAG: hypothetical protein ACKVTZ_00415 [Bacteroidia bacterium]
MSELSRLQRLAKSLLPNFGANRERYYSFEDTRMIITDLGMQIPEKMLTSLLWTQTLLDEFTNAIYLLEDKVAKDIITEDYAINPKYSPKVYVEGGKIAFSITYTSLLSQKEIVFIEYDLGEDIGETPIL